MAKRAMSSAEKSRVPGSIPGGYIYFHFEFFACFPSLQLGGTLANEIRQDHSPVVIVYLINHTRPVYILITAVLFKVDKHT